MTEPVAYWVLQARPTGEILPKRYASRELAVQIRQNAGTDDRVLGMDRYGKVIVLDGSGGSVPHNHCAIARAGRGGGACREQCASCRTWWPS